MTEAAGAAPLVSSDKDDEKVAAKKEFDAKMEAARAAQNLTGNAVPEQRPIASQDPGDQRSEVRKKLEEAGDPRANEEPMGHDAYVRAASKAQADKAAKTEEYPARLFPGARAYIENPGQPDHGRAVAVNRVSRWRSEADAAKAARGGDDAVYAQPEAYECMSRDGRSELMVVSAEHLRLPGSEADWGKTPIS